MNYGEEWAYWYLRLNGFFPINNFVVHRDDGNEHRADIDLLGIRPPHVYEAIGGRHDDWDPFLHNNFDLSRPLALVCEVKTGRFEEAELFRPNIVRRAVKRLGLLPFDDAEAVADGLGTHAIVQTDVATFAKVFFSTRANPSERYLNLSRDDVNKFVEGRVRKYAKEKFNSRVLFPSNLFADITHRVHEELFGSGS